MLYILLTIIALGYWINFLSSLSYGKKAWEEREEINAYQKDMNERMLNIHLEMLGELKKLNEKGILL